MRESILPIVLDEGLEGLEAVLLLGYPDPPEGEDRFRRRRRTFFPLPSQACARMTSVSRYIHSLEQLGWNRTRRDP